MRLRLKNDVVFKAVFGRDVEECKQALIGMLNLLLERREDPIREIRYKNPFNIREYDEQKESILDIKAETDRNEVLDIEMQFVFDKEFIPRNILYHCGMVTQSLAAGQSYGMLKKTISIYLLDHVWFDEDKKYHTCFQLREKDSGMLLTDLVEMHYFELPKVNSGEKRSPMELTETERFLEYLRLAGEANNETDAYFNTLTRTGGKEIEMAEGIMHKVTEEERLREKAIAREKFLHMQASLDRQRKMQEQQIKEQQQQMEAQERQMREQEQQMRENEKQMRENEKQIKDLSNALKEKEQQLEEMRRQLAALQI